MTTIKLHMQGLKKLACAGHHKTFFYINEYIIYQIIIIRSKKFLQCQYFFQHTNIEENYFP